MGKKSRQIFWQKSNQIKFMHGFKRNEFSDMQWNEIPVCIGQFFNSHVSKQSPVTVGVRKRVLKRKKTGSKSRKRVPNDKPENGSQKIKK